MLAVETGADQNCQYNETILTPRALGMAAESGGCLDIPQQTRILLPMCKRKAGIRAREKDGNKAYFIFLLRGKRTVPYKSRWRQPRKYLCSQARLRLTAEDTVTGGTWERSPSPAQHVNSIFIFLPALCFSQYLPRCRPHMYIHY